MKRKLTAFLLALLLALTLCSPALAGAEYGSFYDETEQISSDELTTLGEETFPQLSKTLGVDLRVDVFTDEGVEDSTVWDIATYVYGNSDYGLGEEKEGISLTLLLRAQPDGSYAMAEKDWCVYVSLSQARGNAQELTDVVSDAVKPYMAERAWNGKDLTMSATALAQAMGAMAEASSNYILANCPPDGADKTTETPEPAQEHGRRTFPSATTVVFTSFLWITSRNTATGTTFTKPPMSSTTPTSLVWARGGTASSSC